MVIQPNVVENHPSKTDVSLRIPKFLSNAPKTGFPVAARRNSCQKCTINQDLRNSELPTFQSEEFKLEWTKDLSEPFEHNYRHQLAADAFGSLACAEGNAEYSRLRFDFSGKTVTGDIPLHHGLHHHGLDQNKPGYSVPEILHLARSRSTPQRLFSAKMTAAIFTQIKSQNHREKILAMYHDLKGFLTIRMLADDKNPSVIRETLSAISVILNFVNSRINGQNQAYYIVRQPVGIGFALETASQESSTLEDHANLFRLDISLGFLVTNLLDRVEYLLFAFGNDLSELCLSVLCSMCNSSAAACKNLSIKSKIVEYLIDCILNEQHLECATTIIHRMTQQSYEFATKLFKDIDSPFSVRVLRALAVGQQDNFYGYSLELVHVLYSYGINFAFDLISNIFLANVQDQVNNISTILAISRAAIIHLDKKSASYFLPIAESASIWISKAILSLDNLQRFTETFRLLRNIPVEFSREQLVSFSCKVIETISIEDLLKSALSICENTKLYLLCDFLAAVLDAFGKQFDLLTSIDFSENLKSLLIEMLQSEEPFIEKTLLLLCVPLLNLILDGAQHNFPDPLIQLIAYVTVSNLQSPMEATQNLLFERICNSRVFLAFECLKKMPLHAVPQRNSLYIEVTSDYLPRNWLVKPASLCVEAFKLLCLIGKSWIEYMPNKNWLSFSDVVPIYNSQVINDESLEISEIPEYLYLNQALSRGGVTFDSVIAYEALVKSFLETSYYSNALATFIFIAGLHPKSVESARSILFDNINLKILKRMTFPSSKLLLPNDYQYRVELRNDTIKRLKWMEQECPANSFVQRLVSNIICVD